MWLRGTFTFFKDGYVIDNVTGIYNVAINYFGLFAGKARYQLEIGDRTVGQWIGDSEDRLGHEPSRYLDGHTATRITFRGVAVQQGEMVRITGQPNDLEAAPIDYISFFPPSVVDWATLANIRYNTLLSSLMYDMNIMITTVSRSAMSVFVAQ